MNLFQMRFSGPLEEVRKRLRRGLKELIKMVSCTSSECGFQDLLRGLRRGFSELIEMVLCTSSKCGIQDLLMR